MNSVETQKGNSEASLTKRLPETEERILGIKDNIEEINTIVKVNVKYK